MGAFIIAVVEAVVIAVVVTSPIICFMGLMRARVKNMEMNKEPKLPHKLKWGDRTAAKVDEVEYLIGIRVVGYTVIRAAGRAAIRDVIIAEVHESVADEVRAWSLPEDLKSPCGCDVFKEKPRAGAYYKYIKLKNIVHEES